MCSGGLRLRSDQRRADGLLGVVRRQAGPAAANAKIAVYNVAGQRVATVVDREFPAGSNNVVWNGMDTDGRPVPAGIYFYRIDAGANTSTKKMIVLR